MGLPAFRPSRHGFPFANEFDYPGHLLGRGAAVCAPFGLSAGFCWAALDRYLAQRWIARPVEAPKQEEPLFLELLQRQTNAIMSMGWDKALRWQRLPDEARGGAVGLAEMTRLEWRWVRRSLDASTPIMLYLIRAGSAFDSPFENQFVLAYRYELDRRTDRVTIWVYDPNRPDNDEVRLTLRSGPRRAGLEAHLAVKDEVRGFFAVAYDREVPPALAVEEARGREGAIVLAEPPSVRLGRSGRVEAIARGEDGRLLALHRSPSGGWRAEDMDARGRIPEQQRPAATPVLAPRGPRAFARSVGGELVEYHRVAFGWKARSVTARANPAHAFTIDSQPVILATGTGLAIFARHGGDAVFFQTHGGGWRAENLSQRAKLPGPHTLTGELVAARGPDGTRHVFGRTEEGHLLHFRWRKDHGWASQCVTTNLERFGVAGGLVVLDAPDERALHILARNAAGVPLDFRWSADSGWRARAMGDGGDEAIACDPSAAVGPDGTLHAVARGMKGQLLHFWSHGELLWRAQDVTGSHPALGDDFGMDGDPRLAAGPGEWLHVMARRGDDLLVYRWSPDADWSAESLGRDRERKAALACDPILEVGSDGAAHAFGVGVRGALLYLRSGTGDDLSWSNTRARGLAAVYALTDLLALPGRWASRAFGRGGRGRRPAAPAPKEPRAAAAGHGPRAGAAPAPAVRTAWANADDEFAGAVGRGAATKAPDPFATDTLPRSWGTVERAESPSGPAGGTAAASAGPTRAGASASIEPPVIPIQPGAFDPSDLAAAAAPPMAEAAPAPPPGPLGTPVVPMAAAEMQRALERWEPTLPQNAPLSPRPVAGGPEQIPSISLDPAFIGWDPTAPRAETPPSPELPAEVPSPADVLGAAPPPADAVEAAPPPADGPTVEGLIIETAPPEPSSAPLAAERGFDFFDGSTAPPKQGGHAAPLEWSGAREPSSEDLWGPPKQAEPKGPRPWETPGTPPAGNAEAAASPALIEDPAFTGPWAPPPGLPAESAESIPSSGPAPEAPAAQPAPVPQGSTPPAPAAAVQPDTVLGLVTEEPGAPTEDGVPRAPPPPPPAAAPVAPARPEPPAEVAGAAAVAAEVAQPDAGAAIAPAEPSAPAMTDEAATAPPPAETDRAAMSAPPAETDEAVMSAPPAQEVEAAAPEPSPAEDMEAEAISAPSAEASEAVAPAPVAVEEIEAEPVAAAPAEDIEAEASPSPSDVEPEPIAAPEEPEAPEATAEEAEAEDAAPPEEDEAEELVLPASFGSRPAWLAPEAEEPEPPTEAPPTEESEPADTDDSALSLPASFGMRWQAEPVPTAEESDAVEANGGEPVPVGVFEAEPPVEPSEPEASSAEELDVALGESLPQEEPLSQPGSDVADLTLTARFQREDKNKPTADRAPDRNAPNAAAAEGSAVARFDLSDLHLPETAQQQADAARDAALKSAASDRADAPADGGVPADADTFTLTPGFGRRRGRGRKAGAGPGHGKKATPADPLLDTVDAIIAEAYSTRAQPQAQGSAGETRKAGGFPDIQALPDYLILVPEGAATDTPPADAGLSKGGAASRVASPDPHATDQQAAANGSAPAQAATGQPDEPDAPPDAPAPAPVSAAPPAASKGMRRRASRREAALDGLPLLEPFQAHGAPIAEPKPSGPEADPAAPAGGADANGTVQGGGRPRSAERNGYKSEREIVLSGLPLLEPPDESPPAPPGQE